MLRRAADVFIFRLKDNLFVLDHIMGGDVTKQDISDYLRIFTRIAYEVTATIEPLVGPLSLILTPFQYDFYLTLSEGYAQWKNTSLACEIDDKTCFSDIDMGCDIVQNVLKINDIIIAKVYSAIVNITSSSIIEKRLERIKGWESDGFFDYQCRAEAWASINRLQKVVNRTMNPKRYRTKKNRKFPFFCCMQ